MPSGDQNTPVDEDRLHREIERSYWAKANSLGRATTALGALAMAVSIFGLYLTIQSVKLSVLALDANKDQVNAAREQVKAAQEQNIIAQRSLVDASRPWLRLSVKPESAILKWGPESSNLRFSFTHSIRNDGSSPALGTRLMSTLVLGPLDGNEISEFFSTSCSPSDTHGFSVFKDEQIENSTTIFLTNSDISNYLLTRKNPSNFYSRSGGATNLTLITCVVYNYSGQGRPRYTGKAFEIWRKLPDGQLMPFVRLDQDLPEGSAVLRTVGYAEENAN